MSDRPTKAPPHRARTARQDWNILHGYHPEHGIIGRSGHCECPPCLEVNELEDSHLWGYVGLVARCSRGQLGLVTHVKRLPWGVSTVGINLLDGHPWSSRTPTMVPWTEVAELAEAKAHLADQRKAATG